MVVIANATISTGKENETRKVHILVEGSQDLRSIHHSLALSTAWQPFHAVRARRVMTA